MSPLRLLLGLLAVSACASAANITPVRIEQTVAPNFPNALAFSPISDGEARLVVNIDDTGKLSDVLVIGYTNEAFADEAVRALRQWRYTPARDEVGPVGVRLELQFNFSASGRVVSLTPLTTMDALTRTWLPRAFVTRVCTPRELDQPVKPVQTVDPGNPLKSPLAPNQTGTVLVDFYVDEKGQARMPVVLNTTHETFAQAAIWAVSQWRFATPTRHGEPVAVRVQQKFVFSGGS